jgi:hypothetical protein
MIFNYFAIVAAAAVAWVFGAAWYSALGRFWRGALDMQGEPKVPVVPMIVSFLAELLMAYVLAGLISHLGGPNVKAGLLSGFFCWVGFVATTTITNYAYQGKRPLVMLIDAAHWLGVLLLEGLVIGAMG